jgi:hypothetical protein
MSPQSHSLASAALILIKHKSQRNFWSEMERRGPLPVAGAEV